MVGGVNAAATFAVLPLGRALAAHARAGPRRRALMIWWPVVHAAGHPVVAGPAVPARRYSPPFLDYIESAPITTVPDDALRRPARHVQLGARTSTRLARRQRPHHRSSTSPLNSASSSWWPASLGLTLRRNPHRLFLVIGVGVGLFLRRRWATWARCRGGSRPRCTTARRRARAAAQRAQVRPGDPAAAGDRPGVRRRRAAGRGRGARRSVGPEVSDDCNRRIARGHRRVAVVGGRLPVAAGRITPGGGFDDVPQYWSEAADLARGRARTTGWPCSCPGRRSAPTSGEPRATSRCRRSPAHPGPCATPCR